MKVGRNDPCPCGSGKKYKHCCMNSNIIPFPGSASTETSPVPDGAMKEMLLSSTGFGSMDDLDLAMKDYEAYCEKADAEGLPIPSFMEYQNRPNMASEALEELTEELKNRTFESESELRGFMDQQRERQNDRPVPEFRGLSPKQMHDLLYGTLDDADWLVSFNPEPDNALAAECPIMKITTAFLSLLTENEGSLPLTPKGNLKRDACTQLIKRGTPLSVPEDMYLKSEDNFPHSREIRLILEELGLTHTLKTKVRLTEKGAGYIMKRQWGKLYTEMFRQKLDVFDWFYDSYFTDHCAIVQDAALFTLYLLKGRKSIKFSELYTLFARAFPHVEEIPTLTSGINMMPQIFRMFFLDDFAVHYGLVKQKDYARRGEDFQIQTTPLFQRLFNWKK